MCNNGTDDEQDCTEADGRIEDRSDDDDDDDDDGGGAGERSAAEVNDEIMGDQGIII